MDDNIPVGTRHIDKGLEEKLKEVYRRVVLNETTRSLMNSLLKSGLCTRDIYIFFCACTSRSVCHIKCSRLDNS